MLTNTDFLALKAEGYSIIANNPGNPIIPFTAGTAIANVIKSRHIAAVNAHSLKLLFTNYSAIQPSQGVQPNYNAINVSAALQKAGATYNDETGLVQPCFFPNGKHLCMIDPGAIATTQPVMFSVAKGEKFFVRTYRDAWLSPAPSVPTLSTGNSSSGFLNNNTTYYVAIKLVYSDGSKSGLSDATSILTGGASANAFITVTTPAVVIPAIGYEVWIGGSLDGLYKPVSNTVRFGTNFIIYFDAHNNTYMFGRRNFQPYVPAGNGLNGGNGGAGSTNIGLNTGEGLATSPATMHSSPTYGGFTYASASNIYIPNCILGKTKKYQKSFAVVGDSIQAGTGDGGYTYNGGGFATRALDNQLSQVSFDINALPLFGFCRVPLGGETAAQFAFALSSNQQYKGRAAVTLLATNIICNYGTNDLSDSLATIQANLLSIAKFYGSCGIKFYQCTILPKTNSTDGWRTANNQTTTSETRRLQVNAWLRDTSTSGFMQQSGYYLEGLVDVIDVCKYTEVNASNVLTQNGGFWRVPSSGAILETGTITSQTSQYEFYDTTKNWAVNQWRGYDIIFTNGAAINKGYSIGYNNTTYIGTNFNAIGATPSVGDAYAVIIRATVDGIHPSSQGHIWAGQAVAEKLNSAI